MKDVPTISNKGSLSDHLRDKQGKARQSEQTSSKGCNPILPQKPSIIVANFRTNRTDGTGSRFACATYRPWGNRSRRRGYIGVWLVGKV
jgi:hypothetical protein